MEKQSHTQEKLNNFANKKAQWYASIKDNLNLIYVGIMIILQILLSLLKFEGGELKPNFPTNLFGWLVWFGQLFLSVFVGVAILNAFRRQGIVNGHKQIKDTYNKYIEACKRPVKREKGPRSKKQYMRQQKSKDSFNKIFIYILISIIGQSLPPTIMLNPTMIIPLIANIILAIAFGIKTMLDSEMYVITELVTWYELQIQKIEKEEELEKNGRRIQRGMPRARHKFTSRIQQKKECRTGQSIKELIKTSSKYHKPIASRLFTTSLLWTPTRSTNI